MNPLVHVKLEPDGWIRIHVDAHDLPAASTHKGGAPKLAIHVNDEPPHYLDPHLDWLSKKPLERHP